MSEQFKVGDKVYCPTKTRKILQVGHNPHGVLFVLELDIQGKKEYLSDDGRKMSEDINPVIFHATPENRELLAKLYGMDFEEPPAPPKPKTPKEVIQAMLDSGWTCVPCYLSDSKEKPNKGDYSGLITSVIGELFVGGGGYSWVYASPIDSKTGKVIIDYVDGEIITE